MLELKCKWQSIKYETLIKKSYSSGPVFLNGGKIFVKQVSNALKTINWRLYQTVSQSMTNEQTNSRSL